MLEKLRGVRGETLTETLAAILIVTLSAVVLTGMAVGAVRLNRAAGTADAAYRLEVEAAERQASGSPGTVTVAEGGRRYVYDVTVTGGEETLASYAPAGEGAP